MARCALLLLLVTPLLAQGSREAPPNILLITVDTLRADYVGAYGLRAIATPHMDALAAEGFRFANAYCQVPLTPPSHASMFTGLYPPVHGMREFSAAGLRGDVPTLASLLKERGYATAAFVSSYVLDSVWGLSGGFDLYYDNFDLSRQSGVNPGNVQRRAAETIDQVLKWAGENRPPVPFFLWVHLYDPHHNYDPPSPFRERFAQDLYAGEVAYVDQELGRLFAWLKRTSLYDEAIITLLSDHGEALGEHGESEHGFFVYENTARIPFLIKPPKSRAMRARVVESLAQTVDLMPTLFQLAGLTLPSGLSLDGHSLLSVMLDKRPAHPPVAYIETTYPAATFGWSDLVAYREGRYKFIRAPKPELYDLSADPQETRNLYATQRSVANQMESRLKTLEGRFARLAAAPGSQPAPEAVEALQSLGYVGGGGTRPRAAGSAGPADPKDKIGAYNRFLLALQASEAGRPERSVELLRNVLAAEPDLYIAHYSLGLNYLKMDQAEAALAAFGKALELNPDFELTQINMARAQTRLGRNDQAIALLQGLLGRSPGRVQVKRQLAGLLTRTARHREALPLYREIVAAHPVDVDAVKMLGISLAETEGYAEAVTVLEQALKLGADDALARNFLGIALANTGRLEEAIASYRAALERRNEYHPARLNLAVTLLRAGKKTEARAEYQTLCRLNRDFCQRYAHLFP